MRVLWAAVEERIDLSTLVYLPLDCLLSVVFAFCQSSAPAPRASVERVEVEERVTERRTGRWERSPAQRRTSMTGEGGAEDAQLRTAQTLSSPQPSLRARGRPPHPAC